MQRLFRRATKSMVLVACLLASLGEPAIAVAHLRTIAPPGNSGVSQYVEDIPTARGPRPTSTINPGGGGSGASSSPGASGRGSASPTGRGSAGGVGRTSTGVPASTLRALARHGASGRRAAALAVATAPAVARHARGKAKREAGDGTSPLLALVKTATGGSSGGAGLGVLLPVIFALVAAGGVALGLMRRRAS